MNNLQKDIIKLVRSALTGEKYELSEEFELQKVFEIAKRHAITTMVYYGAINCGVDTNDALMQQMFFMTCKSIAYNELQMHEIGKIFDVFDNNCIDYMPVKGTLIKKLYPKSEMRAMGDADILIKTQDYSKIKSIMLELGYDEVLESNHEFVWNKANVHIELHKRLIPSYNKDYYAYYGDGWRLAKLSQGTMYSMTDEDQMIYLFTHFAKHYRDAGIGIRHFVDLWVYRNAHQNLDEEYIKRELKDLQLYDFYENIISTLSAWFEDIDFDIITDFITQIIFNSGVYGTREAHILSNAVKAANSIGNSKEVKKKKFIQLVFLPYKLMCDKYPFLQKLPFLLPIMWIWRIFDAILFRREDIKLHQETLQKLTMENIDNYKQALNFVGLDFNFKE